MRSGPSASYLTTDQERHNVSAGELPHRGSPKHDSRSTGDNEREDTTVFWADTTGGNITQLMRNATMGGEGGFRGGSEPQISDDGAEISFTSSGNYVEGTETNKEKLYVMDRS